MKNQKGITLIALVITIIVLLILAGVSIAMLTGENGILNKATTAVDESEKAEAEETLKLAVAEILANKLDPTYTGDLDEINVDNLEDRVPANNSNVSVDSTTSQDISESGDIVAQSKVVLKINDSTHTFYVAAENGKISDSQIEESDS